MQCKGEGGGCLDVLDRAAVYYTYFDRRRRLDIGLAGLATRANPVTRHTVGDYWYCLYYHGTGTVCCGVPVPELYMYILLIPLYN